MRIAINGFGRIGRLALRAAWNDPEFEVVRINEPAGDIQAAAHLLTFDSIQGTWDTPVTVQDQQLLVGSHQIQYSSFTTLEEGGWQQDSPDLVIDCSGKFKTAEALAPYLDAGVKRVLVSAPVPGKIPNVAFGINQDIVTAEDRIISAASCTTNCIAPVIEVLQRSFGVRCGSFTTIHDMTNTQVVLDSYHKDLRRARASGASLIPTTTGSAVAIGRIFPELEGRLTGLAVRVPLANASITDCAFELEQPTDAQNVNAALEEAAAGRLQGILGFENRPLVSVDYRGEQRSAVIDGPSTRVVADQHLKLLAWYDNEVGYAHRMMELARWLSASF